MIIKTTRLGLFQFTVLLAAGLVVGCSQEREPVGRLGTGAGEIRLGYPEVVELELDWQMKQPLEGLGGPTRVFVHLLDARGDLVRTFDHELPGAWKVGGDMTYTIPIFQSALAPPLEEGRYKLTSGLYDQEGNRWPLENTGAEIGEGEYEIATVAVVESGPKMPQFFFSSSWLPVEGGSDLQILARRWLTENGSIRLGGVSEPGELWLNVGIPEGGGELQDPVMADGATGQSVTVSTTCGAAEVQISGAGSHSVLLPITIPESVDGESEAPSACEVRFDANYYLMAREGDQSRVLALEGLSWSSS
jgi:hypothetical protein